MTAERVAENLNRVLGDLMAEDTTIYLLGEDVGDPYGGAFRVTKGLSTRYPDRVLATPLSEGGFVGVAVGLALAGDKPIVEMMFSDFVTLAFDPIVNLAAKAVTMYGRRLPVSLVVRCPTGGGRGYGPTHSQSLQKHFLGVPHLRLAEISAFHDSGAMLRRLLGYGEPCLLFEDKVLYGQRMRTPGPLDSLCSLDFLDEERTFARVTVGPPDQTDCVILAPGGAADRAIGAARRLFLEHEVVTRVVVPFDLYPFSVEPLLPDVRAARLVAVVEESTPGGTWGSEVASRLYERLWGELHRPVLLLSSADEVIPAASHLEARVLLQEETVYERIGAALHG